MREQASNPETEWHRLRLTKDRSSQRRIGIALMILGFCVLLIAVTSVPDFPRMASMLPIPFALIGMYVVFWGSPLMLVLVGGMEYVEGRKPISPMDIEWRRQRERAELFRMAQGDLPWSYRKLVQVLFAIMGILLLAPGILVLLAQEGYRSGSLIWGILYSGCGLLLLLLALVILPRRARQIPAESARALGASLAAGEGTSGIPPAEEPEK
jgi:hypothetical protein